MIVKGIRLKNFRKFEDASFTFKPGINLIVGNNASGKTTIVQAIGFAVYGETLTGLNLRQLLRHDAQKLSDFGYVKLYLENSEELWISREIKTVNNTPTQRIFLSGEEVTTSNINAIKKIFPEKELFYELAFIDFQSQNLLDVNRRDFRELLSRHISVWDIQRVLDNSKSLHVYLQSREKLHAEKVKETSMVLSEYDSVKGETRRFQNEKKELTTELIDIETQIATAERAEVMENVKRGRILSVVSDLKRNLSDAKKLARRLHGNEAALAEINDICSREGRLQKPLTEYSYKVRLLYEEIHEISELLDSLVNLKEDFVNELQKRRQDLSDTISLHNTRRRELTVELEQIAQKLTNYKEQMMRLDQTTKLLAEYESDLEKYGAACRVEEKLESLIRSAWRKRFLSFVSNVRDQTNKHLKDMGINMGFQVTDGEMKAIIQGETVHFEALSGGERELLNLLVRIGVLKELGEKSILILEHPAAFVDQERTSKILSFLNSLKKDFAQIFITTVRSDLPLDVENKLTLRN